ncbi:unnamed protein product [Aphanomyces euteiches]
MSAKPMSPNFFHCPPLSRQDEQRFKDLGVAAAYELAEIAQLGDGPIRWTLDSNEHSMKIFTGKATDTRYPPFTATPHLSTIQVVGTMPKVFDLFRSRTTDEAKQCCRRFGHVLEDAVNLYSIVPATDEMPHESIDIVWRGFKPVMDKILTRRDACLLLVNHGFEFNGKHVWVRCLKSLIMPCCPELPGFVRMTIQFSGYVFVESVKPGYIDVACISQGDAKGSLGEYAPWLVEASLRKRVSHVVDIDRFLRENRLSKTPFLKSDEVKPTALAQACNLCSRRFGPLSKKINCLKCGEVYCHRCIREWEVKNRGFDARAHVCTICALGKRDSGEASVLWRSSSRLNDSSSNSSDGLMTPMSQG